MLDDGVIIVATFSAKDRGSQAATLGDQDSLSALNLSLRIRVLGAGACFTVLQQNGGVRVRRLGTSEHWLSRSDWPHGRSGSIAAPQTPGRPT